MSKARFLERQIEVRNATTRLCEVTAQPETDIVRDATIQRFELTFELVWKTLQLYFQRQGLELVGPRPVLKRAFASGMVSSPEEADIWLQMLEDRNLTSHAYDEALARRIYNHIVRDYIPLFARMADLIETLSWD